jgi:LacI family transcriptional regulator
MRAPSQTQLARKLRLSRATISRALANHPALSADTRARVQALAAELGYRGTPTRSVRRAADAPPLKLGVLIGAPLVPADQIALPQILEGIRARARMDRAAVDILPFSPEEAAPLAGRRRLFGHLRAEGWRGAILLYPFPEATVAMLAEKLSVVSVLHECADERIDTIDTDHGGVRTLVARLVSLGHRRIGFATWRYPAGGLWASRRFAAYAEALFQHGLPVNPAWVANLGPAAHSASTPGELADFVAGRVRGEGVTAWVCAADHQAYQLVADLRGRGLNVPADVSVTGFDGQDAPPGLPRLTSLAVPNADLGASAVARLVGRLLQPSSNRRVTLVLPTLVEGDTTAPPAVRRAGERTGEGPRP